MGATPHRRLLLVAVAAGLFLAALDTYVVVTVLPRMMFDLALPLDRVEQATPIITGFLVGYIVTMPLTGAISDLYGRGRVYLVSLGVSASRVMVVSKGKEQPFCNDDNESCWQQNRRGHFVVTAK